MFLLHKNLSDFYPFNFKEELLYVKNVTFHNYKSKQWESNALRKNDVIFAASKRIKNPIEFEKIKSDLERIIESIFRVAIINGNQSIYLWPIGCGVFRNNKAEVAKLFVKIIKKKILGISIIFQWLFMKKKATIKCSIIVLSMNYIRKI